jgi:hypothetical protein
MKKGSKDRKQFTFYPKTIIFTKHHLNDGDGDGDGDVDGAHTTVSLRVII